MRKEGNCEILSRCFKGSKKDATTETDPTGASTLHMSFAMRNSAFGIYEKDSYALMFTHMDTNRKFTINKTQFKEFLISVSL